MIYCVLLYLIIELLTRILNFIHIHRKYFVGVTYIWNKLVEDYQFGIIIKVGTKWFIDANIADLQTRGIDTTGCYVVPIGTWQNPERGDKIAGCISKFENGRAKLIDYRDQEYVDTTDYTIEASVENINRCIQALLGPKSVRVSQQIRAEIAKLLRPEGQQQRI